jgi:benzoyl-CoA reductase subunit BamC
MCEDVPPLAEPMCVQICARGCLTYSEREVEVFEEEVTRGEMEMGIAALIKKYGAEVVRNAVSRATKR